MHWTKLTLSQSDRLLADRLCLFKGLVLGALRTLSISPLSRRNMSYAYISGNIMTSIKARMHGKI